MENSRDRGQWGNSRARALSHRRLTHCLGHPPVPLEKTADEGPRVRVPVTRVGHPAPGWHWPGPALTVAGIWGVK